MNKEDIISVLEILSAKLKGIKWALVGSANLFLQGITISPKNLDIVVNLEDLEKVSKLLESHITRGITSLENISDFPYPDFDLNLRIKDVDVQILGETKEGIYVKILNGNAYQITIKNLKIPCFSLKSEIRAYSETNRSQKVKLIKDFLNSK